MLFEITDYITSISKNEITFGEYPIQVNDLKQFNDIKNYDKDYQIQVFCKVNVNPINKHIFLTLDHWHATSYKKNSGFAF